MQLCRVGVICLCLATWLVSVVVPVAAQVASSTAPRVDARAEVAAALYAASATHAAEMKVADGKLRKQRGEIERLRT